MKRFYLTMIILGTVLPYVGFLGYLGQHGMDVAGFVGAWFANGSVGGLTADLFISSFVFWGWMFSRSDGPRPWLFIALNLGIGLSCALPAYLYTLERRAEAAA